MEVLQQSPHYTEPECEHFADCGGCSLQHLQYDQQLAEKYAQVRDLLQRIGGFAEPPLRPVLPAPERFHYRNKMEYSFGTRRWLSRAEIRSGEAFANRDFALGLHVRGHFDRILDIRNCLLQSDRSNAIRNAVRDFAAASPLRPYTTRDHSGFWRFLVIREGKRTGDLMVNLVTAEAGPAGLQEVERLAQRLLVQFPEITTLVHTVNRLKAQVATGQETHILHGPGHIHDRIGKWRFRISPASFFQTNTLGAEQLYATAQDFAHLQGNEVLYDLYCGAGTIGIFLSEPVQKVVGIEVVPEAIVDAEINAELNGVRNAHFIASDLKAALVDGDAVVAAHGLPDVVVLDPPRAGVHPKVIQWLLAQAPQRIVYVSCNPATFTRDAALLCDSRYELHAVQPVDMFPHTAHIEVVGRLEKRH